MPKDSDTPVNLAVVGAEVPIVVPSIVPPLMSTVVIVPKFATVLPALVQSALKEDIDSWPAFVKPYAPMRSELPVMPDAAER